MTTKKTKVAKDSPEYRVTWVEQVTRNPGEHFDCGPNPAPGDDEFPVKAPIKGDWELVRQDVVTYPADDENYSVVRYSWLWRRRMK